MSTWSDNPEWYDEFLWNYAMAGHLGSEIEAQVLAEEIEACDIWEKLTNEQLCTVGSLADRAFWEDKYAAVDARREAARENL